MRDRVKNIKPRMINFSSPPASDADTDYSEDITSSANIPKDSIVSNAKRNVTFHTINKQSSYIKSFISAISVNNIS